MKNSFFALILLSCLLCSSCTRIYYPELHTTNTATQYKDKKIGINSEITNAIGLSANYAWSPYQNLGINTIVNYTRNNQQYGLSAGYYISKLKPIEDGDQKGVVYDFYGGYIYQRRDYSGVEGFNLNRNYAKGINNNYFGQASCRLFFGFGEFMIAYKANLTDVYSLDVFDRDIFDDPTYLDRLLDDPHLFHTLMSSITFGFPELKVQMGLAATLNKSSLEVSNLANPTSLYLGFIYNLK